MLKHQKFPVAGPFRHSATRLAAAIHHPVCSELPGESHESSHRDRVRLQQVCGQVDGRKEVVRVEVVTLRQVARHQAHDDTVAKVESQSFTIKSRRAYNII